VVVAINYNGAVELAAVNIAGGSPLDETTLITTTAAVAAGNSATAYYSTIARTSVAYRVVGYIESTQATAGTWATTPSTIQGMGGQALTAMSSLGYGQTWQNVTASRLFSTTYYNTTGKPIQVAISHSNATVCSGYLTVGGAIASQSVMLASTGNIQIANTIVPPNQSYIATVSAGTAVNIYWAEIR